MDYFLMEHGGFQPQSDQHAAVKFSLQSILTNHRLDELSNLLPEGGKIGQLEGDPGWSLERRDSFDLQGFERWPVKADFRAYVFPESFQLAYPEKFYDRATFEAFIILAINSYLAQPDHSKNDAKRVLQH